MKPSSIYFVSGIDTDCGKTYITSQLALWFMKNGVRVITQKPVQTGCVSISDDIAAHREAMGIPFTDDDLNGITCSYLFEKPASPHLSSAIENRPIHTSLIQHHTNMLADKYDVVLVEGAGGLMVPLNNSVLTIDYVKECGYPLILVTNNKLGSINHTLLSLESCIARKIEVFALIYNRFPDEDKQISDDSLMVIRNHVARLSPGTVVVDFTCLESLDVLK